jgi:hypothetical protein
MRRPLAVGIASLIAVSLAHADAGPSRGKVIAQHLFCVTDDFIVDVYHNGVKLTDDKRTLVEERFGATAERIDVEVREGDWLVFNVVNNRLRWGGCSYFAVAGRGEAGVSFTTDRSSGRWSCCDDLGQVNRFIRERDSLTEDKARPIANPWSGGDEWMNRLADGWTGTPIWGKTRNTWIKFVSP